jgi:hypothetical protein
MIGQRKAAEDNFLQDFYSYKFEYLQFLIFLRKELSGLLTFGREPSTIKRDGVVLL